MSAYHHPAAHQAVSTTPSMQQYQTHMQEQMRDLQRKLSTMEAEVSIRVHAQETNVTDMPTPTRFPL
jgi:hypothetical protein